MGKGASVSFNHCATCIKTLLDLVRGLSSAGQGFPVTTLARVFPPFDRSLSKEAPEDMGIRPKGA